MKTKTSPTCRLPHAAFALLAVLALFATAPRAPAQTAVFTDINAGFELPGIFFGSPVAWADYDNDGRLDVVVGAADSSHSAVTLIYRNTGSAFTDINAGLSGPGTGNLAWGDYDNDGYLDLVFNLTLYRNNGNGSFTSIPAGIPFAMNSGMFAWGDYDNDGRSDILFAGYYQGLCVYHNNGDGTFAQTQNTGLPMGSANDCSESWCDYDNDGDLDAMYTGSFSETPLYKNNGDGTFTQNTNVVLPGAISGCALWGDANGDGRPDVFLSGWTGSESNARVYVNEGNGTLTPNTSAVFPGVTTSSAAWGDYDNDGRLDLLLNANGTNQVWRNMGDGSFTLVPAGLPVFAPGSPGSSSGSVAWGDYDNDGRLDILLAGRTGYDQDGYPLIRWAVYKNMSPVTNTPPSAPSGLSAVAVGVMGSNTTVRLSWQAATDAQTPSPALTYNVRVGTTPGGSDVMGPQADSATGRRRLPAWGNAEQGLTALVNLPYGDYYWSVQAVDGAFAGSPFSTESFLRVTHAPVVTTEPALDVTSISATVHGTVNPRLAQTLTWFEYGLTPSYGHQTPPVRLDPDNNDLPLQSTLTDLLLGMTYHYRMVGSNAMGFIVGSNRTVTLLGPDQFARGPALSGLTNVTLVQRTSTSLWFNVSDPDTPLDQLTVQFQCNNPVLFPEGAILLGGAGSSRSLMVTPASNQSGSATIRVTASDGLARASQSLTATVTPAPGQTSGYSPLLYLTNLTASPGQNLRFRLMDAGTGSTNYGFEYRSSLSPTNVWLLETNVIDRGGGEFEVGAGPPQANLGFYRVKGLRPAIASLGSANFGSEEGDSLMGTVIEFCVPFFGELNYTWTSAGTVITGSNSVNGTTAVIPLPITDNTGVDPIRSLTLRLEPGAGYGLAGTRENLVTLQDNDAEWQGILVIPNGLAGATTVSLTNRETGGYSDITLPQNFETSFGFTLKIQQSSNSVTGALRSDGAGFFPTNETPACLAMTPSGFYAAALNLPLPPLVGRPLLGTTQYVSLGLVARAGQASQSISPSEIQGVATLFTRVSGRPYLDTEVSGTFRLLKPATRPSTNQVSLQP